MDLGVDSLLTEAQAGAFREALHPETVAALEAVAAAAYYIATARAGDVEMVHTMMAAMRTAYRELMVTLRVSTERVAVKFDHGSAARRAAACGVAANSHHAHVALLVQRLPEGEHAKMPEGEDIDPVPRDAAEWKIPAEPKETLESRQALHAAFAQWRRAFLSGLVEAWMLSTLPADADVRMQWPMLPAVPALPNAIYDAALAAVGADDQSGSAVPLMDHALTSAAAAQRANSKTRRRPSLFNTLMENYERDRDVYGVRMLALCRMLATVFTVPFTAAPEGEESEEAKASEADAEDSTEDGMPGAAALYAALVAKLLANE